MQENQPQQRQQAPVQTPPVADPTATPVPAAPAVPVPVKSNNILVAILGILVVLLLGATAYLYYANQQLAQVITNYQRQTPSPSPASTPDPTANWKTYRSEKYNFSFKYPSEWQEYLRPVTPGAQYVDVISYKPTPISEFTVVYFPDITNLEGWVQATKDSGLINTAISGQKNINGNTFTEVVGLSSNGEDKTYFIKATSKGYLKIWMEPYDQKTQGQTFDQILSTFQFTK